MAVNSRHTGLKWNSPSGMNPGKTTILQYRLNAGSTGVTSGDIEKIFKIEAGNQLLSLDIYVVTAEAAADTIDIGLYAESNDAAIDADGIFDGIVTNPTAGHMYRSGPLAYAPTVDAYVGVLANATLSLCSLIITASVLNTKAVG